MNLDKAFQKTYFSAGFWGEVDHKLKLGFGQVDHQFKHSKRHFLDKKKTLLSAERSVFENKVDHKLKLRQIITKKGRS